MKNCARCGEPKDDGEFSKDSKSSDGLSSYCKECKKIKRKEHYAQHPQTGSDWDKTHRDQANQRQSRYRQSIKDVIDNL